MDHGPDDLERSKVLDRLHIIEGLLIVVERWGEFSDLVHGSGDRATAIESLQGPPLLLTEIQAVYAVDMRVSQRTGQGRQNLASEADILRRQLTDLE